MIKKLSDNQEIQLSKNSAGQRELIRQHKNKINELIDYLEAKEEASKGEGKLTEEQFDKMAIQGFKWAKEDEDARKSNPPETKGECTCKEKSCLKHSGYYYYNPPEHEEEWERDFRDKVDDGEIYGRDTGEIDFQLRDYIRDNFVSKEKIKTRYDRQRCADCEHVECKELDKFVESLGLGD